MKAEKAIEYLERRGLACLVCRSWDIEGGSMNFDAGEIAQSISCHECGERWTDIYKLVSVADSDFGEIIASIPIQPE